MWFTKSRRAQSAEDFETWIEGGVTPTLNSFDNGDIRSVVLIVTPDPSEVCKDDVVRRLTPLEYERQTHLKFVKMMWSEGSHHLNTNGYKVFLITGQM